MIPENPQKEYLLQVKNLAVDFRTEGNIVRGVRDVSFDIHCGETVAQVQEGVAVVVPKPYFGG